MGSRDLLISHGAYLASLAIIKSHLIFNQIKFWKARNRTLAGLAIHRAVPTPPIWKMKELPI